MGSICDDSDLSWIKSQFEYRKPTTLNKRLALDSGRKFILAVMSDGRKADNWFKQRSTVMKKKGPEKVESGLFENDFVRTAGS